MSDEPAVRVTMTDIYNEVKAQRVDINRMCSDLNGLRTEVRHVITDAGENKRDIDSLKRRVYGLPSLAVLMGLGALVVSIVQAATNGGG